MYWNLKKLSVTFFFFLSTKDCVIYRKKGRDFPLGYSQAVIHSRQFQYIRQSLNWDVSAPGSRRWLSKDARLYGNQYLDPQMTCVFSPKTGLAEMKTNFSSKFSSPTIQKKNIFFTHPKSYHNALLQDLKASEVVKRTIQNIW